MELQEPIKAAFALGFAALLVATGCGSSDSTTSTTGSPAGGCEDDTAKTEAAITSSGLAWTPACVTIKAGGKVTWSTDFTTHPLIGGTISKGEKSPDDQSPIKATTSGTTATFTFRFELLDFIFFISC